MKACARESPLNRINGKAMKEKENERLRLARCFSLRTSIVNRRMCCANVIFTPALTSIIAFNPADNVGLRYKLIFLKLAPTKLFLHRVDTRLYRHTFLRLRDIWLKIYVKSSYSSLLQGNTGQSVPFPSAAKKPGRQSSAAVKKKTSRLISDD